MLESAANKIVMVKDKLKTFKSKAKSSLLTSGPVVFSQGYNWLLAKPAEIVSYAAILNWDIERVRQFNLANIFELVPYTFHQLEDTDKQIAVVATAIGFRAYSGLVRYVATKKISEYYGRNTMDTRTLAMVPYAGDLSTLVLPTLRFIRNRIFSRGNLPILQN